MGSSQSLEERASPRSFRGRFHVASIVGCSFRYRGCLDGRHGLLTDDPVRGHCAVSRETGHRRIPGC